MAIDSYDGYSSIQLLYRLRFIELLRQIEQQYEGISDDLKDRIEDIIQRFVNSDGNISKKDLEAIKQEIDSVTFWFSKTYGEWINQNISQSIDLAILGQDTAATYFIKRMVSAGQIAAGTEGAIYKKVLIQQQYGSGLNNAVRQGVWNKRWEDGFTLSDRVWTMDKTLRQNLHGMIEQCANEGRSAVEFSRAVEKYLMDPGPKWTTGIKPAITERGTLRYNALRLARTENNQAFQRAQDISARNSAIVKGQRWNLSKSHPKKDICDVWASQDIHGLGPGVYRVGEHPIDHPNGLCYLTDELYRGQELIEVLKKKYKVA